MKKVIATSLAFAMLLGLSSCGDSTNEQFESNQRASMEAEKARSTTESTTSEVIQYDPLENVKITINSNTKYPEFLGIDCDYNFENYDERKCINAKIVSADTEKIVVELSVDKDAVAKYFGDTPYTLINDKKEVTFIINEDVTAYVMNTDRINENDICELNGYYNSLVEENKGTDVELKAIYASVFANNETFLSDCSIVENGKELNRLRYYDLKDSLEQYELWFVYKDAKDNYYYMSSWGFIFKKDYHFNTPESSLTSRLTIPQFKSLEEAKQGIENYIAKYDNVKLEELEIPEALK